MELQANTLMKLRADAKRFSIDEGNRLAKEWQALLPNPSTLRIWQYGIIHADESAFDAVIIECTKRVHESKSEEWLSPA